MIICQLPIKTKIIIGQGFKSKGDGSHRPFLEAKFDDTYSVDFELPVGTPIYTPLDGIVDEVVDKFRTHYSGSDWKKGYKAYLKTNYLVIRHKKNVYSLYHHIKYKSGVVKKGQKVKIGQLICYSGNIGWSASPHLHFSFFKKTKTLTRKTIPFRFRDYKKSLDDRYYKKLREKV